MPFDIAPISADEQGLRIMQEPKQKVSPEAVPPKVKMTNGGREQGDVPSLLIVGNYDWNMAKSYALQASSYVKKAQLLLSLLDLENPNHEPAGQSNGGQFAEGQGYQAKKPAKIPLPIFSEIGMLEESGASPQSLQFQQEWSQGKLSPESVQYARQQGPGWKERLEDRALGPNDPEDKKVARATIKWIDSFTAGNHDGIVLPQRPIRKSLNKVPSAPESDIISKQQIIKGERSANGYRSYWLLENGEVKKSIVALTDAEADELMNDNG